MTDIPMPPAPPPDPSLVVPPTFVKGRCYTLADLMPIVEGNVVIPNFETLEPIRFLNDIAAFGHMLQPKWGKSKLPYGIDPTGYAAWTQYFLKPGDGEGSGVRYGSNDKPIAFRFAICRHKKHSTGTADGERYGHHPGFCEKCGLDMSYDSGD